MPKGTVPQTHRRRPAGMEYRPPVIWLGYSAPVVSFRVETASSASTSRPDGGTEKLLLQGVQSAPEVTV